MAEAKEAKVKYNYMKLSLPEMMDYIEKNAPSDKAWFKKVAFKNKRTKDGVRPVYQHLVAKKAFCEKYMPEIIPVKNTEVKEKKSDLLANW